MHKNWLLFFSIFCFVGSVLIGCTIEGSKESVKDTYPDAVIYELANLHGDYCFISKGVLYYADWTGSSSEISQIFTASDKPTEQVTAGESDVDVIVGTLIKYHGTSFRYNVANSRSDFGKKRVIFVKDTKNDVWYYKFDGSSLEERSQIATLGEHKEIKTDINLIQE
jgi:hypothetical protein